MESKMMRVGNNLAGLLQLIRNHKSHEIAHRVTGDNVWTVRLDTVDESDVVVGQLLCCREAVDGTKVLVTNDLHFIGKLRGMNEVAMGQ